MLTSPNWQDGFFMLVILGIILLENLVKKTMNCSNDIRT
jgi:hypothetical protein